MKMRIAIVLIGLALCGGCIGCALFIPEGEMTMEVSPYTNNVAR